MTDTRFLVSVIVSVIYKNMAYLSHISVRHFTKICFQDHQLHG